MKIAEILKNERTLSFEFFPPKTPEGNNDFLLHIEKLKEVNPSFVSVTYGAGGSTKEITQSLVIKLASEKKLTVMAHLTCISHNEEELIPILENYRKNGIENILALRGDPPNDGNFITNGKMKHASDLMKLIKEKYGDTFCIGGAVFPEKHPESPDWESEMRYLKLKIESGMEFGISQLFFDNNFFYDFMDKCEKYDIEIPIIPGIMPITNYAQIERFTKMCKATLPEKLRSRLEKYKESAEDIKKIGIEYGIHQCEDLLKNGVVGLHFYTLNKSYSTLAIYSELIKYFY